jgi:ribosomal protein S18 acetylase RimI-like enzyme
MSIELRRPSRDDIGELGRIAYESFRDIAERHGFPPDFESVVFAQRVLGLMLRYEDIYSLAAYEDGRPRGVANMIKWGSFGGIGPVAVDIEAQEGGIGRKLMLDLIEHGRASGFASMRLNQDSFNMRSLALYASVGFDLREPLAYMTLRDDLRRDPNTRPATPDDIDAMDALCRDIYRVSRRGEMVNTIAIGLPAVVYDDGRIRGYMIGTAWGHGVAESDEVMLALFATLGAMAPGSNVHVPMREAGFYRRTLAAGHRNRKIVNLMTYGPYDAPSGTYVPSGLG